MTTNSPKLPEATLETPESPTIDQALAKAACSTWNNSEAMGTFSIRIPKPLKAEAMAICERNGADLGSFLRECTKALVEGYGVKTDLLAE